MEFIKVIVRNCLKSIFFTGRKPRNLSLLVLAPTRTGNGVGRVLFVPDLFLFSKENIEIRTRDSDLGENIIDL